MIAAKQTFITQLEVEKLVKSLRFVEKYQTIGHNLILNNFLG